MTCRHANTGTVQVFHLDRVKPFYGSLEESQKLAQVDYQQFIISSIVAYQGDPHLRSKMEFLIHYEDGTIGGKSLDKDLFDSHPQLRSLVFILDVVNKQMTTVNKQGIHTVRPGLIGYMDLRRYSFDWYAQLGFLDEDTTTYVLQYRYGDWVQDNHHKIRVTFTVTGAKHIFNHITWSLLPT